MSRFFSKWLRILSSSRNLKTILNKSNTFKSANQFIFEQFRVPPHSFGSQSFQKNLTIHSVYSRSPQFEDDIYSTLLTIDKTADEKSENFIRYYVSQLNVLWKSKEDVCRYYLPFKEVDPSSVVDISLDLIVNYLSEPDELSCLAIENIFTLLSLGATESEVKKIFSQESLLFVIDAKEHLFRNARICSMWNVSLKSYINLCCNSRFLLTSWELDEVLEHLSELGVTNAQRVVNLCPNIANMTYAEFVQKMDFLKAAGSKDLHRTIELCPNLLNHSLKTLEKRFKKLEGFAPREEVEKIFDEVPHLLHVRGFYAIETFNHFIRYFGRELGLELVQKHPLVLTVKWTMVYESYCGLKGIFGEEVLLQMVKRMPGIIQISWAKLKMKLDFLMHDREIGIDAIANSPTILNRSLERVLIPRFQILGKYDDLKKLRCTSLNSLFNASDSIFHGMTKAETETKTKTKTKPKPKPKLKLKPKPMPMPKPKLKLKPKLKPKPKLMPKAKINSVKDKKDKKGKS